MRSVKNISTLFYPKIWTKNTIHEMQHNNIIYLLYKNSRQAATIVYF